MTKLIWVISLLLVLVVLISGVLSPMCVAGSPQPCKDTEHPNEPPCNMKSCARQDGSGSNCTHWCHKGKGCCFCQADKCNTGA